MFKILIAEDDRELRQLFQHVLLKNGYTVKGVSDGQEALDALEKDYYDLIISDIMMPNMDSEKLSTLARIRRSFSVKSVRRYCSSSAITSKNVSQTQSQSRMVI